MPTTGPGVARAGVRAVGTDDSKLGEAGLFGGPAIARELVGFVWAIACEVQGKPRGTRVTA